MINFRRQTKLTALVVVDTHGKLKRAEKLAKFRVWDKVQREVPVCLVIHTQIPSDKCKISQYCKTFGMVPCWHIGRQWPLCQKAAQSIQLFYHNTGLSQRDRQTPGHTIYCSML